MKRICFLIILAILGLKAEVGFASSPPNIVLILGEAQGWASMSTPLDDRHPEGSKSDFILTPHLDQLASAGMRFSDFYAASPRCTPTRAALVTGLSPARLHMTFVNEGGQQDVTHPGDKVITPHAETELPPHLKTMAGMLHEAGYATAHFGKWHLGRRDPREYGFDESDGPNGNEGPDRVESANPKQCYAIAQLGMDFMTRQVKAGKPFFLQLSEYPGRGAAPALPETMEVVRQRLGTRLDFNRITTAAGDEEIDKTIGLLLARLKDLGALENTYVIYTADHGAQGRRANGMLTNGKGTVWEGGLRVPLLVSGPGVQAGTFSHQRGSTVDLLPTIAELAGISPADWPAALEGGSLAKVLGGDPHAPVKRVREEFVVHFPHYDKDDLGPASAIYLENYKMIRLYESAQRRVFDVDSDVGEQHDLAPTRPDLVSALDQRLSDYLAQAKAQLPATNPNYDPNGERSGDHRKEPGGKFGQSRRSAGVP
jgi:arylsulfatase A